MRLSYWFFIVAILAGLCGMALGIQMGIAHDFTLMPVHAHVNLIGWASMFLYGLYYRAEPAAVTALAKVQFGLATTGLVLFSGGLAAVLYGNEALLPVAIVGSLLAIAAMAVFLVVVVRRGLADARLSGAA